MDLELRRQLILDSACPVCGENFTERQGKFGTFFCCPNSRPGDNHGTISLNPLQNKPRKPWKSAAEAYDESRKGRKSSSSGKLQHTSLEREIQRQMLMFGIRETEMDQFLSLHSDDYDAMNELGEPQYPDHWSYTRPY